MIFLPGTNSGDRSWRTKIGWVNYMWLKVHSSTRYQAVIPMLAATPDLLSSSDARVRLGSCMSPAGSIGVSHISHLAAI